MTKVTITDQSETVELNRREEYKLNGQWVISLKYDPSWCELHEGELTSKCNGAGCIHN